jgi:hypothetical protein
LSPPLELLLLLPDDALEALDAELALEALDDEEPPLLVEVAPDDVLVEAVRMTLPVDPPKKPPLKKPPPKPPPKPPLPPTMTAGAPPVPPIISPGGRGGIGIAGG